MPAVHARKDKIVTGLTGGIEMLFKKNKIDWIKGTARLTGGKGVEVTLHAGATQAHHGDEGTHRRHRIGAAQRARHRGRQASASSSATRRSTCREVPKSIAIMGSGAVGVEFASIFSSYGSEVTIIELLPRLVPGEDEAVSTELEKNFKKRGIKSSPARRSRRAKASAKGVDLEMTRRGRQDAEARPSRCCSSPPAAVRSPTVSAPRRLGLKMERGYIVVDELFRTSVPGISAIGDVITMGGPHYQLAHVSSMEGILLAERIAGHTVRPINYDHVPRCTYCEPEIGSVGLTEAQAKAAGLRRPHRHLPVRALGRARMAGETDGFVKIVADKKYDEVLGVHIIGPRATELVAEAVLALRLECTVEELVKTIHAHPTMSEAVGEAAHAAHGAAIHI